MYFPLTLEYSPTSYFKKGFLFTISPLGFFLLPPPLFFKSNVVNKTSAKLQHIDHNGFAQQKVGGQLWTSLNFICNVSLFFIRICIVMLFWEVLMNVLPYQLMQAVAEPQPFSFPSQLPPTLTLTLV